MGEVYRAHDTKLGRDVAIKVLPQAFLADSERVARFDREARTLASLNHPNIGSIYGLEEANGITALVMELVEGEDLAQRIAGGAVTIPEAVAIAKQTAEALKAAHEQGIIHRDLKPANIKVRADGTVKVLDFGLAKAMEPTGPMSGSVAVSPTITTPAMTLAGMILGTAAYMSPEQAKGRTADKRSDVWAFGCVLFEMLTGRRAFDGADMTDVLGAVVRLEPNWEALSSDVSQPIRTLLRNCLVKDRQHRVADISTALFVLDQGANLSAPVETASVAPPRRTLWRRLVTPMAAAVLTSTVVGTSVWVAMRPAESVAPRVSRLVIAPSATAALTVTGHDLAITPDGTHVVYVGNRGTQLFVRALDTLEPVAVFTGGNDVREPFISPDGQWIGFSDGAILKKVAMTGGPAVTLAALDTLARGAIWNPDDTIIVATNATETGLQKVTPGHGPPTVLTRPDRAQGEADHLWPEPLPGSRAVLFTITAVAGGLDAAQVAVLNLQTGMRTVVLRGGSHARYVPIPPGSPAGPGRESGHLVYAAAGALWMVPFDLARLQTRGTAVPVVPDVVTTELGGVDAVVAGDGTLAYVSGGVAEIPPRTLVWVDRQGRETPIPAPPRPYRYPRLSPAGTQIVVYTPDQANDLWVWDLRLASGLTRATFEPGVDSYAVWTPDGSRIIFTSERTGTRNLFWQAADGTGTAERLTESPNTQTATAMSPDGHAVIFTEISPTTRQDVMAMTLDRSHRVTPLVQSAFIERNGVVSPDGRWLAYEANDSGQFEIWIRPFPDVNTGHWLVSTAGGTRPLWSRNGQELFYLSPAGALMRVGVTRGPSWAGTTPALLVKDNGYHTGNDPGRSYDISADGQRFLVAKQGSDTEQTAAPASLVVVLNWGEELKRLVPTK